MCIDAKKKQQMIEVGERVRAARIKKGLMPQGLCKRAGFPSVEALSALEAGNYLPCESRMNALAAVLCVDAKELMGEEFDLPEDANMTGHTVPAEESTNTGTVEKAMITPASLKLMREELGIGQRTAAKLCGVGQTMISFWENEKKIFPADKMEFLYQYYKGAMASGKKQKERFFTLNKERIQALRNSEHLSQKEAVELLGVSNSMYCLWENGKRRIKTSYVKVLSEYFNVPAQELVKERWEEAEIVVTLPDMDEIERVEPVPAEADEKQDGEVPALTVSISQEKTADKKVPAGNVPEDPEKAFCRNVLSYMEGSGVSEETFEAAVGTRMDDFRQTAKTGGKLELGTILKAAGFFGKSVEEIVSDDNQHAALLKEREELMARAAQLKKILGM